MSSTNQMIAALAGGSLPFILRTVMQPEKPEIEIGTVSFKNQMDEIIKNFVQYWPIYDLPFDMYTAEDEEKDRQKKKQEQLTAEGKDRRLSVSDHAPPSTPGITLPMPATNVFQFESGADTLDGRPCAKDNHIGNHVPPQPSETTQATATSPHVCFDVDTKDEEPKVDIVIYLPNKVDETWLDEWSDLDNDDAANSSDESTSEVFQAAQIV